jgi:hypothetical protein
MSAEDEAAVVQMLPPQFKLRRLERRGAWTKVQSDSNVGWVRMMHLGGGATLVNAQPLTAATGLLSEMEKALRGNENPRPRAQAGAMGIRGLTPEQLRVASANTQALAKVKTFSSSEEDAKRFALEAQLRRSNSAHAAMERVQGPVK